MARACMTLCLLCFSCTVAFAAEGDAAPEGGEIVRHLDTVVVSASGIEQKITDAPASITVISQEELTQRPFLTLLDALRTVEGVDIGETTDKTGQGTISIRGMGADYTLVLVNGRRQNNNGDIYPNSFGGNQFNHMPPLDAIERIEVIRGPMSTLYGADAMGGVVNIITKKTLDTWHGSVSVSKTFQENTDFGNDSTTNASIRGPIYKDKLGISLFGSFYERDASNPKFSSVTDPSGTVHERSLGFGGGGRTVDNEIWSAGGSLTFTPTVNHDFILDLSTSRQKYDNSSNQLGTLDSMESILRHTSGAVQPRVGYSADQRFERDQWAVTHNGRWGIGNTSFSVSYVDTANLGRSMPFTVAERQQLQGFWNAAGQNAGWNQNASGNYQPSNAQFNNNWSEAEKLAFFKANLSTEELAKLESFLPRKMRKLETREYTYDLKYDVLLGSHMLVVGGQYIDGEMEDGVFGMTGTDTRNSGKTQPHEMWSLFVEDNWELFSGFTLTGGVRHDHHNEFGGQTSPRIYSVWNFLPAWTLKGGISTGYKTPKTSQLFDGIIGFGGQGTMPLVGNPDLKPEESVNYELALYYQHADGHNFNITGFYNRFKNKISSRSDQTVDIGDGWGDLGYTTFSQAYNIGRADIKGIEFAGRLVLPFDLGLKANYTFTDSEQKSGPDKGLPLTNNAKHMLNATLSWTPLDGLEVFFEGEHRSKRYRGSTTEDNKYYKSYQVYNLGTSYAITDELTVNARINNLFDKDFTSYQTAFTPDGNGGYTVSYLDDYNVKSPSRSFWLGINYSF